MRRLFIAFVIGLFFGLQTFGAAHASQYSDSPHDHDGIACDIGTAAQDQTVILPAASGTLEIKIDAATAYMFDDQSALYITPQGRAPPPRSPPALA